MSEIPECSALVEYEGEYIIVCGGETELVIDDANGVYCVRCVICGKGDYFDNAADAIGLWFEDSRNEENGADKTTG